MKSRRPVVIAFFIFSLAVLSWAAFAQNTMREGNWEVSMQMEMAGMEMKMPEFKTAQCVTKEQINDPVKALPQATEDKNNDCKVSEYKVTGNKATWKMACTMPMAISGAGEITYGTDTYDGSMTMTTDAGNMMMKYKGKRLGDCPK